MTRFCRRIQLVLSLITIALLAGNLLVFGRIAAGIGQISHHLAEGAVDPVIVHVPVPGTAPAASTGNATATASGNVVHLDTATPHLPAGPRTVEQVAAYLRVTPDTIRDSYIPAWISAGHMTDQHRLRNRWLIPDTFDPYRPK